MSAPTATVDPTVEAPRRHLGGAGFGPVPMPAPGAYPVPDHHRRHVVERDWDGAVWTDHFRPAPAGTRLARHRRHLFGFLRGQGWKLTLALIACLGIASALWADDRHAHVVGGIQLLLPVFSLAATAITMTAYLHFVDRRVAFDRIAPETRREIFRWGAASAVIGFGLAFGIEVGLPQLFGSSVKDSGWSVLAGPAEETGKLLVPAILWYRGRFRLPREGYLLVLVAACGFGVMEGFEYAFGPDNWQPARPVFELLHPLLTGFVAAVAWQVAWKRRSTTLFTGAAVGAWCIAMLAHSTNDFIVLDKSAVKALTGITVFVAAVMYLLQKHSARQLVPPDKVGAVSPRWRPAAPRHSD
ncbi:MAG TPA: PrsW family glutamic-type intramembrane protease [Solirubrobacterales bacterium]|nr:PrsW family glutamic-type intramembrane protease [Solirubrobacterales bacterium]